MIVLKCIFLLMTIVYTFSNIVKAVRGQHIGAFGLWAMGIGIVGTVLLNFWLGI